MTYGVLKNIVGKIKQIGKELYPNSKITVGETFDIGPEFAVSDFKYNRHKEITSGQKLDTFGFVDATALLNGDNRRYAAYPEGIPDKTPFATFLGKQANIFLRDMGFDYIWLSNGFGFSDCPWSFEGKVFDGKEFMPDRLYGSLHFRRSEADADTDSRGQGQCRSYRTARCLSAYGTIRFPADHLHYAP